MPQSSLLLLPSKSAPRPSLIRRKIHESPTSAALLASAPLLGAGIDRVVRGALIQDIEPLDLAARARIVIDNADHLSSGDLADLPQLADT